MDFVDLKRSFVPIGKDEEISLEVARFWGREIAGWLDWPDLLDYWRVVLLAEAASGKTKEFRHQAEAICGQGKAAFFVRIEDLADEGFEHALDPSAIDRFHRWRSDESVDEGWFFLDSVDEARLNQKSLDRALRHFVRELGRALERARVYLSCRVSDWRGSEDRAAIERYLPVTERSALPQSLDDDAALLDPLFQVHKSTPAPAKRSKSERNPKDLIVVRLAPLVPEQQRRLAVAAGVDRPADLVTAIERRGLDSLAERPGDLLDMAAYWNDRGCFGSLAEMTEHGVNRKLGERDRFRRDNQDLTPEWARLDAERLAAALTLGKSFTLRVSRDDPDPELAAGALEPAVLLENRNDAQTNALIRRGIFTPATYGRVRFHHRGTQEYLTASWLKRLLQGGCPRAAVWSLLFAERYGVATLVPSLHPIAAWLALDYPDIRDEIIRREPLVLIRHADPRSLPLEAKERLLRIYAERHRAGEIGDDNLDHRALWMFATPDLADTIRQSWAINQRSDFRKDLLRMVRDGKIGACIDLARGILVDDAGPDELRLYALQVAEDCNDMDGLKAAARWWVGSRELPRQWMLGEFAAVLFPRFIGVDDLLALIRHSSKGFADVVIALWRACPDADTRERFIVGIADCCVDASSTEEDESASSKHDELTRHLASLATAVLSVATDTEPSAGLIHLLMAVERASLRGSGLGRDGLPLYEKMAANLRVQRRLFWADVDDLRTKTKPGAPQPTSLWELYGHGARVWQLGAADLAWLYEDLAGRPLEQDQQVALSAILSVLDYSGGLADEIPRLRLRLAGKRDLEEALDLFLAPRPENETMRRFREDDAKWQQKQELERREAEASWKAFRDDLKRNPSVLRDPALLVDGGQGVFRLHNLAEWLFRRVGNSRADAEQHWQLLEEGFGRHIAEAYRDGIKLLWRITPPGGPGQTDDERLAERQRLSAAGLGVEAAQNPDWARCLTPPEAERAVLHACYSDHGYPRWLDSLIDLYPMTALPILRVVLREEWVGHDGRHPAFLDHFSWSRDPLSPSLDEFLLETVLGRTPMTKERHTLAFRVLRRLRLGEDQRKRLLRFALTKLRDAKTRDDEAGVLGNLRMLFIADPDRAITELIDWIDGCLDALRDERAQACLGKLFDRHEPSLAESLPFASVSALASLVGLAYRYVRPDDDCQHDGVFTPGPRDRAQSARSTVLGALLERPGADAYWAMRTLAKDPAFSASTIRFSELAHGKAEGDAELPPWTPAEVLGFERRYTAPAKSGEALLRVAMSVLQDIQDSLDHADASSRPLLERAKDEDEVQKWLADQMTLRADGRFHVHREAQIARGDKPDIIVSSTAAPFEVGVEVKHGGMKWTVRDLEHALKQQLAERYLKPASRRHGILVVSCHGKRTWRHPVTNEKLEFTALIEHFGAIARSLDRNQHGAIEARVLGLDASPRIRP